MKIALVHDYLNEFGGAERVLLALSEMWPEAPIYTAFYHKGSPAWERFRDRDIRVSWVHHIPGFATRLHSPLRFLAPTIWDSFDFSGLDVVIGSASWYITKGFAKKGKAIEICYCHTPPRWLYGYVTASEWQKYAPVRAYATIVGFFMRHYDWRAAQSVDYFIANSQETARRIKKFYRREAEVIYPPVEVISDKRKVISKKKNISLLSSRFSPKNYFLVVSRLAEPKRVDLAILAANKLKEPLKIIGTGPDEERLKRLAGPTVEFLGHCSDEEVRKLYAGAKAFLATAIDEDFGLTPVEAMAAGTPVVTFRGSGYLESVVDPSTSSRRGPTGVFFDEPTAGSLSAALGRLKKLRIKSADCISQAQKFSKERFRREVRQFVAAAVGKNRSTSQIS